MKDERLLFVTGRLAEPSLRRVLDEVRQQNDFNADVQVLGISVAALMHVDLVLRRLKVEQGIQRVILPGWCQGDLTRLDRHFGVPFTLGPKDLFDLPEFLGSTRRMKPTLDEYDIEIIAEINHAPRLTTTELLAEAQRLDDQGADVIDLGCIPGESWSKAGDAVRMLRELGLRVSIDSFDRREVESAVEAGAELVLSCHAGNVKWLADLPVELVVIPEDPHDLDPLHETIETLQSRKAKFRIDPILEPIGHEFAKSLERYFTVRKLWPNAEIMMGIGNLTELTDVDSAGINLLLIAVCQELGIRSVLTTEVIPWAQTAVREIDIARRLAYHSVTRRVVPKRLSDQLVMLRDPRITRLNAADLQRIIEQIQDPNFRVAVADGALHLFNRDGHWRGDDPFALFEQVSATNQDMTPSHAFYLGYELCKAMTALTLGKQYMQDSALHWGFLTRPESSHPHPRAVDDADDAQDEKNDD